MNNRFLYFSCVALLTHTMLFGGLTFEYLQSNTTIPIQKLEPFLKGLKQLEDIERGYQYHTVLINLIKRYKLEAGAEVGVSCGFHSYDLLRNSTLKKLYSVDPYIKYDDPTNDVGAALCFHSDQDFYDIFYLSVKDRLSVFGNRSEIVRDFSLEAAKNFANNSLDFVFLDANHTYEEVKKDLQAWYDKVRSGGIVSGDDYATVWPGVPQAIDEFFNAKGMRVYQDLEHPRIWWIIKP